MVVLRVILGVLSVVACRPVEPESELPGVAGSAGGSGDERGGSGGATSGSSPTPDVAPEAGAAGAEAPTAVDPACAAPLAHVAELTSGVVRSGARVGLDALVATSEKFLLYRSEALGTCLWGMYAAEPSSEHHDGVLLVSYGARAANADAACPFGSDAIPDAVAPGALLFAQGEVTSFVPSACEAVAPSVQLRLEPRCPLVVTGTAPEIEPVVLGVADANAIAAGDARALATWSGRLVEIGGVSARAVAGESDAVGAFGVIRLEQTALEIHDAIAFMDLGGGGPGDAAKGFQFGYPTEFARIRGLIHLDYCAWTLAPRDACGDFSPSSAGCAAGR